MRIVNQDGSMLAGEFNNAVDKVKFGVVEGWGTAWIASMKLQVNNVIVSDSAGSDYFVKTLLNKLINYSTDACRTHLRPAGFREPIHATLLAGKTAHSVGAYQYLVDEAERFNGSRWVTFRYNPPPLIILIIYSFLLS